MLRPTANSRRIGAHGYGMQAALRSGNDLAGALGQAHRDILNSGQPGVVRLEWVGWTRS